jgi:hypothetical protein
VVTPTPTATPSPTATPTPTPSASASPAGGDYILIDKADLLALPTSGTAWNTLKTWADKSACDPDLTDQNNQCDVTALAKAIVYARTGTSSYRTQTISMLQAAVGTELPGDTLGVLRGAQALALAADFIDYHNSSWDSWLGGLLTWPNPDRNYSIISAHDKRPNNWGTHAFASRVAIDMYLGNSDLSKAATTARGWFGDRSAYSGFSYGDLSWQADESKPVGINPKGATKSGTNIDGIIPDDARRGGNCCTINGDGIMYTYEALQGATLGTYMLDRAGYSAKTWSDSAILRAYQRINSLGYAATGDDGWQPALVNAMYGTSFTENPSSGPGKGFGFADWLFQ